MSEFTPRQFGYDRLDTVTSAWVRKQRKPKAKECFTNALHGMVILPGEWMYVEGWVVLKSVPIVTAHGWLEKAGQDRRVYDRELQRVLPGATVA